MFIVLYYLKVFNLEIYVIIYVDVIIMEELFERLNIKPKDLNLYKIAFSHSSYVNEHKAKQNYERLEFLGDSIVNFIVAEYLYSKKRETEGEMTRVRASYVCENALYEYSMNLGLNNYILVGHGEESSGGKFKKAIVADIFEALVAAIYLDLGFSTVRRVVLDVVVPYIEDPKCNFFSDYELIDESGPAHDKEFKVKVVIDGISYGEGVGRSKKEAEQNAAKVALDKVVDKM